jgi:hypothetical protein
MGFGFSGLILVGGWVGSGGRGWWDTPVLYQAAWNRIAVGDGSLENRQVRNEGLFAFEGMATTCPFATNPSWCIWSQIAEGDGSLINSRLRRGGEIVHY